MYIGDPHLRGACDRDTHSVWRGLRDTHRAGPIPVCGGSFRHSDDCQKLQLLEDRARPVDIPLGLWGATGSGTS